MVNHEEKIDDSRGVVIEIGKRFADRNMRHPQHQGVGESEVTSMIGDAETAFTEVAVDGGDKLFLPQLARIEHFEWLNTDFFQRRFPDDFERNALLNFIDIPGTEPGAEVVEKLRSLAEIGGVVTFETASCDPGSLERIVGILDAAGIGHEDPQLMGSQTYFAGQAKLLTVVPSDSPHTLGESYDILGEENIGMYDPATKTGVVLQHHVSEDVARYMYDFYEKAYEVLNDHPCRQGLSPDEFLDMAVNDAGVDKLIYFNNGVPEALYLACNDLSKLSWVNQQYYQKNYPEQYAKGQLVWFPGIATDPRPEVAGHNTQYMIGLMAELVAEGGNDFVALMDFCDVNAEWLPGYLESEINKTSVARIEIPPIAKQQYWSVRLTAAA